MSQNIDNILDFLKDLSVSTSYKVTIPSSGKDLVLKQLNTEQLKELLETVTDTAIINNNFDTVFYNILESNLLTENINIDDLTIYDAYYIALQTRINCLSELYTIHFSDKEIETHQLLIDKYKINLKDILDRKALNYINEENITENHISITCKTPTIKNEKEYIKYFADNLNTFLDKELQNVIGEIFIYEIVKSIKNITINDTLVDFSLLSFADKINVVKQLPSTLTGKIIVFLEKYKQTLYDLYLVDIETKIQNQTIILQKELQYNATLFNY